MSNMWRWDEYSSSCVRCSGESCAVDISLVGDAESSCGCVDIARIGVSQCVSLAAAAYTWSICVDETRLMCGDLQLVPLRLQSLVRTINTVRTVKPALSPPSSQISSRLGPLLPVRRYKGNVNRSWKRLTRQHERFKSDFCAEAGATRCQTPDPVSHERVRGPGTEHKCQDRKADTLA